MLTPIETVRKALNAATSHTDYSLNAQTRLVLPFFRAWRAQPIIRAWMDFTVPFLLAEKTNEEAAEMQLMLQAMTVADAQPNAGLNRYFQTRASALYATADVYLTAYALLGPVMLRYEEQTLEEKQEADAGENPPFKEAERFISWFMKKKDAADTIDALLNGRMAFTNRDSLAYAPIFKERADDMLASIQRMTSIEGEAQLPDVLRLSVAARLSAAIVMADLMQKNADWYYVLAKEVIRAKGQYKRLMGREKAAGKVALKLSKAQAARPADQERIEKLVPLLFFTAEKAGEAQSKAHKFFFEESIENKM